MVIRAHEMDAALRLFQAGKSKAEIGRELGKDKKAVSKLLARAISALSRDSREGKTHGTDD